MYWFWEYKKTQSWNFFATATVQQYKTTNFVEFAFARFFLALIVKFHCDNKI